MGITALSTSYGLNNTVTNLRDQLDDLQIQLVSGMKSQSYGGLGSGRNVSLATRAEISSMESYSKSAETALFRLQFTQSSLGRVRDNFLASQGELRTIPYEPNIDGQTLAQATAKDRLEEVVQLLNSDINGRYLFGGRSGSAPPVASMSAILDGAGGKDGLKTIIAERKAADQGADGRGRLVIPAAAGSVVSLAEDTAGSVFGLKLNAVNNSLSGTSTTGPAGSPPALSVTFGSPLPQDGEQISIEFNQPDGTTANITLKASTSSPLLDHEFLVGATSADTAANFQNILAAEIETLTQTKLEAASALQAGNDFFNISSGNPPQRVDGPPFATATALKDASTSDTVFWYTGDLEGNPRDGAVAKVDEGYSISYGVRADEFALMDGMRVLSVLAAETFDASDADDAARYSALSINAAEDLSMTPGKQSVASLQSQLGYKESTLKSLSENLTISISFSQSILADVEGVDNYELGVRLLELQTNLEASYKTTATLSRLSLVNFL